MTILVTGGAGFIGSNFIIDWLDLSEESVLNVDKLTYAGNIENLSGVSRRPGYHFIQADINDRSVISELLGKYKPRAIVHFAAESHVDRSIVSPFSFVETNVLGTFNLLEAAKEYWGHLGDAGRQQFRFLHVSTDEVYGTLRADEDPFSEETAYKPNSPYSASKAASDHLVRAWGETYGLPTLTTNCSNNYGPYQFPEKLIPLMITNALSGRPLPVYGDGLQVRDWLYVKDHCSAIRAVLESGSVGQVYNIGGQNEINNITVVQKICSLLDELRPGEGRQGYSRLIKYVTDRPGHDRRYAIDASKINNEIGWKPSHSFETGIQKTVEWYLSHSDWISALKAGAYNRATIK